MIDKYLRGRIADLGIDPNDGTAVADLAAVGVTLIAWRNGPVEEWHQQRSWLVSNPELMRANAATTRAVREMLGADLSGGRWSQDSLRDGIRLFRAVGSLLSDGERRLPSGHTVREWAHDHAGLEDMRVHVDAAVRRWLVLTAEYDIGPVVKMLACATGYDRPRWWLTPWWPAYVDAFLHHIDTPQLWCSRDIPSAVAQLQPPPEAADPDVLRWLLLAGPDRLSAAAATYCWQAQIGSTSLATPLPPVNHRDYRPVRVLVDPHMPRALVHDAHHALSDSACIWA